MSTKGLLFCSITRYNLEKLNMDRRKFITNSLMLSGALVTAGTLGHASAETHNMQKNMTDQGKKFRPLTLSGFGGVAIGNGFAKDNKDIPSLEAMDAAWQAGVRYYDTSPWYGLGISERRMGLYLKDKNREDYTISTKIGRLLHPEDNFKKPGLQWGGQMNASYTYDYSAAGARKSVEDSLQRLGIGSLDIVFVHDLSPDNGDMGKEWLKYFEEAKNGAFVELTKMREEGLIKGWGLGVNTIEPMLKAMEVADPDIFLSACQYSLIVHEDDLNQVFPKVAEKGISIVVGAPLCAGFLAGKGRYLYGKTIPDFAAEKLVALRKVADNHQVDLRTAALQFSAAPDVVSAVIPGASSAEQATANAASFEAKIPNGFWEELKAEKLIAANAPVPNA
ncbi:D-threo-aldose 1-dehydrogenase [Sphingobacterium lactis]|uniref:D-threo-aldose 1-dehydrogenase n=2 Tax=Sphingobacterium lactis TaxID=797291 RepID=A0A1H5UKZ6_9SPHI|nr:D-threo-aldose 1-dehydrogenase [Sphingobacterium lactis]